MAPVNTSESTPLAVTETEDSDVDAVTFFTPRIPVRA